MRSVAVKRCIRGFSFFDLLRPKRGATGKVPHVNVRLPEGPAFAYFRFRAGRDDGRPAVRIQHRSGPMSFSLRQSEILDIARLQGKVTVEDLAGRFNVTLQTIRRDLGELAEAGRLERVHGGAVVRAGMTNIGYEDRRRLNADRKKEIAQLCAAQIPHNSSLFINLGTTTEAVAQELMAHQNLTVVTNNMNVANTLVSNESCEIMVTGGLLRRSDGGLVGDLTAQIIEQFKVDYAVIGTSALDAEG